jgi:2-amino-4-hydroxy-6-hydroxymethyldihydropteridine diphosphokinase
VTALRTAYIGMGANLASRIGPPDATLAAAVSHLESLGNIVARSSLYSTEPVGFADQPRFTNAVAAVETDLAPQALLESLLDVERAFGRDHSEGIQNGPRTLDLDILLIGDVTIGEARLEIPHPRLAERAFVLVPLHEIAPQAIDPVRCKTVAQLLDALRKNRENDIRDVVPIESDLWTPGRRAPATCATTSRGTETRESHSHR